MTVTSKDPFEKGREKWKDMWDKYQSAARELDSGLKDGDIAVDIVFDDEKGVYLALTSVGPDAHERFPSGGSISQLVNELTRYASRHGLRVIERYSSYSEQIDMYTGELQLAE